MDSMYGREAAWLYDVVGTEGNGGQVLSSCATLPGTYRNDPGVRNGSGVILPVLVSTWI